MLEVFLDSLEDSLRVFLVAFIIYFILSFLANRIVTLLNKHNKLAPLFGSLVGIVPECGVPVVGADLYAKGQITTGTIIAIFLACSDEAIPVLISNNAWSTVLALIGIKIIVGFLVGFLVDAILKEKLTLDYNYLTIEEEDFLHQHLLHPLIDAIKVFCYVFIINLLFGIAIYYIGETNIINFLQSNFYLAPVLAVILGLIPNCAPSLLMAELYIIQGIPFAALLAGLAVNAGLGLIFLLKQRKMLKKTLRIILILVVVSLILGYATLSF